MDKRRPSSTRRPGCEPCRHARRLAGLLLVAALLAAAGGHGDPARGEAQGVARVSDPPPAQNTAASAATPASAPLLLLRTVALRSARRGEAYKPLRLVDASVSPHQVRLEGVLPAGMALGEDGLLRGAPERTGLYDFRIEVVDDASRRLAQQAYALRVVSVARPAARAASAPAPAASPVLRSLGSDEAEATTDLHRETPISYLLTGDELKTWLGAPDDAPPATSAPEATAVAVAAEPADAGASAPVLVDIAQAAALRPTVEQLKAQLAPLADVEFPTRPLFEQAILAGRCEYYRAHVEQQSHKRGLAHDLSCPPAPSPGPVPPGHVSLTQFYDALLPADIQAQLVTLAEKRHPLEDARPLLLQSVPCGCNEARPYETVYGLMPFWLATEAPQLIDFGLFSRIGFMGAMLKDDGSLSAPTGWNSSRSGGFARAARQHGSDLDLVIYRRDWPALLDLPQARLEEFVRTAARNAVLMVEARFEDARSNWLEPLLMPAWREREQVYGGLTLFFDDASVGPSRQRAFKRFHRNFTLQLIAEMAAVGRRYHLNLVVPGARLGDEDSAYGFQQLADYMESAQPKPSNDNADLATRQRYRGRTDISVHYLVMLSAPTASSKFELRRRVDHTPYLRGYGRVAFLQGVIPVLFGARSDKPLPVSPDRMQQTSDDIAYAQWNFGGAGMWPTPVQGMGQGTALEDVLAASFEPSRSTGFDLCRIACPNRLLLRLLLESTLTIDLLATLAYAWSCRIRRALGARLLLVMWGAGLVTLVASCVFFSCDPLFGELRASNVPLYTLILLLCVAGAVVTLRPRVEAP